MIQTPHITPEQRRQIEEKIPKVQSEIRKRYHVRRLTREFGFPGKMVAALYAKNVIPIPLFEYLVKVKNMQIF